MYKNKKTIILIILTFMMLGIALFISLFEVNPTNAPFELLACDGNKICAWFNKKDNTYYYFLPSYLDLNDVKVVIDDKSVISIDGCSVKRGEKLEGLSVGKTYSVTIAKDRLVSSAVKVQKKDKTAQNIRFEESANVSTVYVKTSTGTMEAIYKSKNNSEVAAITVVDENGKTDFFTTDAHIKGRGNSSWEYYEKKPFSILFNEPQEMLSMGASSKWALLANALDKSGIRNALVFDTARNVGLENTTDYAFVDLYLNGEYNGLYMLCQNPETFYERDSASSGATDSNYYLFTAELLSRAGEANYPMYVENGEAIVDVCIPKRLTDHDEKVAEAIVHDLDSVITGKNAETENDVIFGGDELGKGVETSGALLSDVIDIDSWVKKYLIDEIFENYDAGIASSYFYKNADQTDSKVYAGPVWDYDNTMGIMRIVDNPEILFANNTNRSAADRVLWYSELYSNDLFFGEMVKCFEESFIPQIENIIEVRIDELSNKIHASKHADDIRWNTDSNEDYDAITEFLSKRLEFLKLIWLEKRDYVKVTYYKPNVTRDYKRIYVPKGTSIADMLSSPSDFSESDQWYIENTSEKFDLETPVTEEIVLVNTPHVPQSFMGQVKNLRNKKDGMKILESIGSLFLLLLLLFIVRFTAKLKRGVK